MKLNTKMRVALLGLVIVIAGTNAFAQQPDLLVYYTKGGVSKISGRKSQALKKGDKLSLTDGINVPKQAQLVLICKNHNGFKVSPGTNIKVSSLASKCTGQNDFTEAYFRFIWDQLVENDKKPTEENYLHNIGAVSRGTYRMNIWPDTINYFSGTIKIAWVSRTSVGAINVFEKIGAPNPLKTMRYSNNSFNLDSLTKGLKGPGIYYWSILNINNQNKSPYYLRLWDRSAYRKKVVDIMSSIVVTNPAETAYMSGFMMERNCFLVEAAAFYKKANSIEPNNTTYKKAYKRFYE